MNAIAFLLVHAVFSTRQFAVLCERRIDVASRQLIRLAREGGVTRLTRGVWAQPAHPRFTPTAAVPLLLGNEQGYVSFLSAMHLHGLISQIPGSIEIATTGHTRQLDTPVARYEFLRIQPAMMRQGIAASATEPPYNLATAAKALIDTLYIATRNAAASPACRRWTWGKWIGRNCRGCSIGKYAPAPSAAPSRGAWRGWRAAGDTVLTMGWFDRGAGQDQRIAA